MTLFIIQIHKLEEEVYTGVLLTEVHGGLIRPQHILKLIVLCSSVFSCVYSDPTIVYTGAPVTCDLSSCMNTHCVN